MVPKSRPPLFRNFPIGAHIRHYFTSSHVSCPEHAGGLSLNRCTVRTGAYNGRVKIYVAINKEGDWIDRHDRRRHITETDWWLNPHTTQFRNAAAGDLFFVKRKHPNNELFTCARLKCDYREESAKRAWRYTSEAYSEDSTYRERAAGVLKIPVKLVTPESKIGLIVLEDLDWFPGEHRPHVLINKFTVNGLHYITSNPEYQYLVNLPAQHLNVTSEAIRNSYTRVTKEQEVEILLLHKDLAGRFGKWLRDSNYRDLQPERRWVDIRFRLHERRFMAELKICYHQNTRQAIREAIGQVIEYNHYPRRTAAEEWWIILDQQPTKTDATYIRTLRARYLVPLHLGYEASPGEFRILKS
jgi:hypothetical protein